MKKILIALIMLTGGILLSECSSDDIIVSGGDVTTRADQKDDPLNPNPLNPCGPNGESTGLGGGGSYHWLCSKCGFINSFVSSNCISCGTINPDGNTHKDPENPSGPNTNVNPPNDDLDNAPVWYVRSNAQKYFNTIANADRYKNDPNYANGFNYAWSNLVKKMKINDALVTKDKCRLFIADTLSGLSGSYKEGFIDGVSAAISAYNVNVLSGILIWFNPDSGIIN